MTMPTAAEITRLYLYGATTIPNLADDNRIRPPATNTNAVVASAVDINDYMDSGPGRFVNAASFEVVRRFFESVLLPKSPPGGFTKEDLFGFFGMLGDTSSQVKRRAVIISQSDFADSKDDLLERAYIWQTTGFQIDDQARFFVAADGIRTIINFGIKQYSSESKDHVTLKDTENFDFVGGGFISNQAGSMLKPMVDPSSIGRIVNIPFTGDRTLKPLFTSANFYAAVASQVKPTAVANLLKIQNGANQFVQQLFDNGAIKFLDPQNRPILYGTDAGEQINGTTSVTGVDIAKTFSNATLGIKQPIASFTANGIAYIVGNGADIINAGSTNDYLDGGTGDDRLNGGVGADAYVFKSGEGHDTIIDSDKSGSVLVGDVTLTGSTTDSRFNAQKHRVWKDSNNLEYVENGKDLLIRGDSLGSGEITIKDFDFKNGALGITLKQNGKVALGTTGEANPFSVGGAGDAVHATLNTAEGLAESLKGFLNKAAAAGDKIVLALAGGNNSDYALVTGDDTIPFANGPITLDLAEGQTELAFAFLNTGDVDADAALKLTATYIPADGGEQATYDLTLNLDATDEAADQALQTTRDILGDLAPIDFAPEPGIQMHYDDLGNVITNPGQAESGRADTLYDSAGNDQLMAGAGDDFVVAQRGGNDLVELGDGDDTAWFLSGKNQIQGGVGADFVYGGSGDELVEGGAGADILRGSLGDDRIYGDSKAGLEGALATNATQVANGLKGDWLDGGSGRDHAVGSAGNDALLGGGGSDTLIGGGGDDLLLGDSEGTLVLRDWQVTRAIIPQTGSTLYQYNVTQAGVQNAADGAGDALYGGTGDDWIIGGAGDDFADGGADNDVLFGGEGNDTLLGNTGNDIINGDDAGLPAAVHGNDFLDGGEGDDKLYGMGGSDSLFGGAGNDLLNADSGDNNAGKDYLDGEDGNDQLYGGALADTLYGGAGNDTLAGDNSDTAADKQGDDYLDGEDGDDTLYGMGGADTLYGGAGNDTLAGDNSDTAVDKQGDDYLDGGNGDDTLYGLGGADILYGSTGNDELQGGSGKDTLDGGDGADLLIGGDDRDVIKGGAGNDQIAGDNGGTDESGADDIIYGEAGNDTIVAQGGDDVVDAGADDDLVLGGAGNDTLAGGTGNDQLQGGIGDDRLDGGDGSDILFGEEGNDVLQGGAGNDYLLGGAGDDLLDGGEGDDVYYISAFEGKDRIVDAGGTDWLVLTGINWQDIELGIGSLKLTVKSTGQEIHLDDFDPNNPYAAGGIEYFQFADGTVMDKRQLIDTLGMRPTGTPGDDTLSGTALNDTISALAGNDEVSALGGNDTIYLDAGDDFADAGAGNDLVYGGDGNDQAFGGDGDDTLRGGTGDDSLSGDAGNDHLYGEAGNDLLAGGAGSDFLDGGDGDDTYFFARGDGQDTATDGVGSNRIVLEAGLSADVVAFARQGNDLWVSIKNSTDRLTVKDWFATDSHFTDITLGDDTFLDRAGVEALLARNQTPLTSVDSVTVIEDSLLAASGNVLANDSDPEGRALRVTTVGSYAGAVGTLSLAGNGAYSYTLANASSAVQSLAAGQTLSERFAYTVTDDDPNGAATSESALVVTVRGSNDLPVLGLDSAATVEDSTLAITGNVLANDRDVDAGTALTVADAGIRVGSYGTLTLGTDGRYAYNLSNASSAVQSLSAGQRVAENFAFMVGDGMAQVGGNLAISVSGQNDAPFVVTPLADQSASANSSWLWQVPTGSFKDVDAGDVLTYGATLGDGSPLPTWLAFNAATQTFSGRVPKSAAGNIELRVGVADRTGATAADSFTLSFAAGSGGGGGNGGGNAGGSQGNEGVGNGVDAPPPGHDASFNDTAGATPGHPGAQGGNGYRPPARPEISVREVRGTPSVLDFEVMTDGHGASASVNGKMSGGATSNVHSKVTESAGALPAGVGSGEGQAAYSPAGSLAAESAPDAQLAKPAADAAAAKGGGGELGSGGRDGYPLVPRNWQESWAAGSSGGEATDDSVAIFARWLAMDWAMAQMSRNAKPGWADDMGADLSNLKAAQAGLLGSRQDGGASSLSLMPAGTRLEVFRGLGEGVQAIA